MSFWKEIPLFIKLFWLFGILLSIGVVGFSVWIIIKLLEHWNIL